MALLYLLTSLPGFLPTPLLWHLTAFLEGMVQRTLSIANIVTSCVVFLRAFSFVFSFAFRHIPCSTLRNSLAHLLVVRSTLLLIFRLAFLNIFRAALVLIFSRAFLFIISAALVAVLSLALFPIFFSALLFISCRAFFFIFRAPMLLVVGLAFLLIFCI